MAGVSGERMAWMNLKGMENSGEYREQCGLRIEFMQNELKC